MDIKITGITFEIMEKALDQAKAGREHILKEMNKAIKSSRKELSKHTPKMETLKVDKYNENIEEYFKTYFYIFSIILMGGFLLNKIKNYKSKFQLALRQVIVFE